MTTTWTKEPQIYPAGSVGGDLQMDDGFNIRYRAPEIPYVSIDENWFVERTTQDADDPAAMYHVTCQTFYIICSNPDDPGGTEMWSDYKYDESVVLHETVESAHQQAERDAQNSQPADLTWEPLDEHWDTVRDAYTANGLAMPHARTKT